MRCLRPLPLFLVLLPSATAAELPFAFEANRGQAGTDVEFLLRRAEATVEVRRTGMDFVLPGGHRVLMRIVDGSPAASLVGEERAGTATYLLGAPDEWIAGVPRYRVVRAEEVRPGVDLVLRARGTVVEYDLEVVSGPAADGIALEFEGASLRIDETGGLELVTPAGVLRHGAPVVFSVDEGERIPVPGRFELEGSDRIAFRVPRAEPGVALVIDPVIDFSGVLGGSGLERVGAITAAPGGATVVVGTTFSANLPTTPGVLQPAAATTPDVFVARLGPSGNAFDWITYLGGSGVEEGRSAAVDAAGNVWLIGDTTSTDFPTTANALDTTFNGANPFVPDAFLVGLSPDGTQLVYGSYFGGSSSEVARGMVLDGSGVVHLTGFTLSTDLPTTAGAPYPASAGSFDAFVARIDPAGGAAGLLLSTYLGGSASEDAFDVDVDALGRTLVGGYTTSAADFPTTANALQTAPQGGTDVFLARLDAAGATFDYVTRLGGSGADGDAGLALGPRVHALGGENVLLAGVTQSMNFPVTASATQSTIGGLWDAFASGLDLSAGAGGLLFSTYLGGSGQDDVRDLDVDPDGSLWLVGVTRSANFPVVDATQPTPGALGNTEGFVTKMAADGALLLFSTFIGGSSNDEAASVTVRADGRATVLGQTFSANFPSTPNGPSAGGGGQDAFVVRYDPACDPAQVYGTGTAGSGGFVPSASSNGAPRIGNPTFVVTFGDLLGGAPALLALGVKKAAIPTSGITLLVDPAPPFFLIAVASGGMAGVPGTGALVLPAALPNDAVFVGIEVDLQLVVSDPAGPAGFAASPGLAITFCDA